MQEATFQALLLESYANVLCAKHRPKNTVSGLIDLEYHGHVFDYACKTDNTISTQIFLNLDGGH